MVPRYDVEKLQELLKEKERQFNETVSENQRLRATISTKEQHEYNFEAENKYLQKDDKEKDICICIECRIHELEHQQIKHIKEHGKKLREKEDIIKDLREIEKDSYSMVSCKNLDKLRESIKEKQQQLNESMSENKRIRTMINEKNQNDSKLEIQNRCLRDSIQEKEGRIRELDCSKKTELSKYKTENQKLLDECRNLQNVNRLHGVSQVKNANFNGQDLNEISTNELQHIVETLQRRNKELAEENEKCRKETESKERELAHAAARRDWLNSKCNQLEEDSEKKEDETIRTSRCIEREGDIRINHQYDLATGDTHQRELLKKDEQIRNLQEKLDEVSGELKGKYTVAPGSNKQNALEDMKRVYREAEATVTRWESTMRRIGIWVS